MTARHASCSRPGLSLMECLVSLAIFLMSLAVLAQLITFASDRAIEIEQRSEAAQLCESVMSELVAGVLPVQEQAETEYEEDPNYKWSVAVQQGPVEGLFQVTVLVVRPGPDGSRIETSLTRMLIDPTLMGSTQDVPSAEEVTEEDGSGGTTGN